MWVRVPPGVEREAMIKRTMALAALTVGILLITGCPKDRDAITTESDRIETRKNLEGKVLKDIDQDRYDLILIFEDGTTARIKTGYSAMNIEVTED